MKVWPLIEGQWQHEPDRRKIKKALAKNPLRPVTLADHEAAEAAARDNLDMLGSTIRARTRPNFPQVEAEGVYGDAIGSTYEIRGWADDVILDCKVWEYVAQDLLDFKEQIKADHEHAERSKVVKAFIHQTPQGRVTH